MNEENKILSEEEIDEFVITQADDDDAWEDAIFVKGVNTMNPNDPIFEIARKELERRQRDPMYQHTLKELERREHNPAYDYMMRESQRQQSDPLYQSLIKESQRAHELQNRMGLNNEHFKAQFERHNNFEINALKSNVAYQSLFDDARFARKSLLDSWNILQRETEIAKYHPHKQWRELLGSIGEDKMMALKQLVDSHISNTERIAFLAQTNLLHLSSENLGNNIRISFGERNLLINSFNEFSTAYRDYYSLLETSNVSVISIPPQLSRLPVIEYFNAVDTLNIISVEEPENKDDYKDERTIVRSEIALETTENLEILLTELDPRFINMLHGARLAIKSNNPEKVRHFVTSYRELFTHVLHKLAPDEEIKSWSQETNLYDEKCRPTRKARLLYIYRNIMEGKFSSLIEKDIAAALAALDICQKGTHEIESGFGQKQLEVFQLRMESTLSFMLVASKEEISNS